MFSRDLKLNLYGVIVIYAVKRFGFFAQMYAARMLIQLDLVRLSSPQIFVLQNLKMYRGFLLTWVL